MADPTPPSLADAVRALVDALAKDIDTLASTRITKRITVGALHAARESAPRRIADLRAALATHDDEVARLRAEAQRHVDAAVHYRNLAIALGAKPTDMLDAHDRKLADGTYTPQTIDEVREAGPGDLWDEIDRLRAEVARLRGGACPGFVETTEGSCGSCGNPANHPAHLLERTDEHEEIPRNGSTQEGERQS